MSRDPGGGLTLLLSPEQLWDKLSLDQGSIFGRRPTSCFFVQEGKIPVSLPSLHRLSCLPHPASFGQLQGCVAHAMPASSPFLQAQCC